MSVHLANCIGGVTDMHIIWFMVIGLIAGWLAGMITKGRGFGVFINLVVGVLGALLGGFLFGLLGLSPRTDS